MIESVSLRHLGDRGALHLDRLRRESVPESRPLTCGLEELVAGEDRPECDPPGDEIGRCIRQSPLNGVQQPGGRMEPELVGRVEEGNVARLIGGDAIVAEHPGVVLNERLADDHVADVEIRIEAPGHPGEDEDGWRNPLTHLRR